VKESGWIVKRKVSWNVGFHGLDAVSRRKEIMVSVGPIDRILSAQLWRESTVCDKISKATMFWVLCDSYVLTF